MKIHFFKYILLSLLLLMAVFPVMAQTSEALEAILEEKAVSNGQAAWFTLGMALNTPIDSEEAAFKLAQGNGWFPASTDIKAAITLSSFSYLVFKAFELKGGFMYRIFENPRYAYRELKERGVINGRSYSNFPVSGEMMLQVLVDLGDDKDGAF